MILVRDIFYLKFGKAKEAKLLLKEAMVLMKSMGFQPGRAMTDLTGKSYTLVMETQFKDLSDLENTLKTSFANEDWGKWYQKFIPLVESGEREIFSLIDM